MNMLKCCRDIPAYNKYVLTHETKEALKTPQVQEKIDHGQLSDN